MHSSSCFFPDPNPGSVGKKNDAAYRKQRVIRQEDTKASSSFSHTIILYAFWRGVKVRKSELFLALFFLLLRKERTDYKML